ncbi:MAG: ABC transporter permease DevC [Pseudomonadota bacterium]
MITQLLTHVLGRLPIGWLQLTHNRTRLLAALAGVAFANILIFAQLGFLGAITESTKYPYRLLNADILIYSPDTETFAEAGTVPRQRMYQALAIPGVEDARPIYIGPLTWDYAVGRIGERFDGSSTIRIVAADPGGGAFSSAISGSDLQRLRLGDTALADRKTRGMPVKLVGKIDSGRPHEFEANGRTLTIEKLFDLGAGFDADGYMIVSDQTFFRLFPMRTQGAPNYILITVKPGTNKAVVAARLRQVLSPDDTVVETLRSAAQKDEAYQTTEKPIGVIFGFGVAIGVVVGIIIVYQVLSTDVADHLSEYATFKAIGYPQKFFLGIVFEQSLLLAFLGFIPGLIISLLLYALIGAATGLPISMPFSRPFLVFAGTVAMCALSGYIATRRLASANPADLF